MDFDSNNRTDIIMKKVYSAPETEALLLSVKTDILQASVDSVDAVALPVLDRPDLGELW